MTNQYYYRKPKLYAELKSIALMLLLFGSAFYAGAQTTVIMPHQGVDTLYVSSTGCYTILDPGGYGKYTNNEDSYLYIIADESFYLETEFETGHQDDGKDWIRVYYDTNDWYGYEYMCGEGTRDQHLWTGRALIHFHSNSYNTFEGFRMQLVHTPSVFNPEYTVIDTSSVHLTWSDYRSDATSWTVYYSCEEDSVQSIQSNTNSVTLTGLTNDKYYRYYIVNNVVDCIHVDYQWFAAQIDSTVLMMRPNYGTTDTVPAGACYRVKGSSGDTLGLIFNYTGTDYIFNNGHGVYLQGVYQTQHGEVSARWRSNWNDSWYGDYNYHWNDVNVRSYYQWFPRGMVSLIESEHVFYNFAVLPENSSYVVPTVSGVTATGATISWSDAMNSSSYQFRYCKEEGQWTQLSTTTPSVTLTGLEPGCQYVFTIEGDVKQADCDVPARHGFITTGTADTIVMPYRGSKSVVLQPRQCYTVVDAGGDRPYFNTDQSRLLLKTANGKGFRIQGRCNLDGSDRLIIDDGYRQYEYSYDRYDIEHSSITDSLVIYFQSDVASNGEGIVLNVFQVEDSIVNLHTVSTTATSATVAWTDLSAATTYTVHYGLSEDAMQSVNVSTNQATLIALQPGTQYVYYVTSNIAGTPCTFSDRRGFITQGLPADVVLMPFRDIDTLILQPNNCYYIYDGGGKNHHYFNNDTSVLVIMSSDGSDFRLDGQWLYGGNEAMYHMDSYDSHDRISYQNNPNDNNYWWEADGWYNRFVNNDRMRLDSYNGYMRLRFTSSNQDTRPGFCFTVDRTQNEVENVKMTRVTSNSATVTWVDNSGASQWTVAYGVVGGSLATATTNVRNFTLNNLFPNTDYEVKVYAGSTAQCNAPSHFFTTLEASAIVMNFHGNDTVYLTPGQCYYVYDPGGTGDYLPSDTSHLVLRSVNGEGFYYYSSANVGEADRSDQLNLTNCFGGSVWWGCESWVDNGEVTIDLYTNEAIQSFGFWMRILFPSRVFNPDTLNMTDSTVTITWQDTTTATHWNFSYGTHIDSMTTVTTNTKQYTMTGLERNRQYFYSIYNTVENSECELPNYFGVIMPTDPGVIIDPYQCRTSRHLPLYHQSSLTLTPDQCYRFMDVGGVGNLFWNSENYFDLHTTNNQGLTIEGYYDFGESSIWISTSQYGSWYGQTGYLNIYAPDGNVNFQQRVGTTENHYLPGFDFNVSFNYKIYNVRAQNVDCTSATLLWDDSTSATQWTLVYGPTEKMLDTMVLSTKSAPLTNLLPDHQYVCYLSSNDATLSCLKPVKYCFITTCDTTIFVLPYNKDSVRVLDINECYTIRDGGSSLDYLYTDHHNVMLQSSSGNAMTLRGNIDMGPNDYLRMWDAATGEWLGEWGKQDNLVVKVPSGRLQMDYNSAGDTVTGAGFDFKVTFSTVSNIQISLKTDTTCRLTWDDNSAATQWVCHYGRDKVNMDSLVTDVRQAHLSGLVYGKRYYVFFTNNSVACIDTTWFEFCAGGDKCIDFGDIYSCFSTGYYGRFNNPREYKGLVDYGPDDINSRHTMIDDTLATDPRTGNQLRCVPPGYYESVRLGNWDIGGEAESIVFEYDVDTTKSEILLLRYAAVLENPGHSPNMQPRFRFSLVDENDNDINTECYTADFVSGDALGWNLYQYDTNTVLWKDWTAVGIDLAPLHGQRVYVKLTTYDCNEMGHFGYAYFTLECQQKEIAPDACGVVHANTFTAPEGFRYEWYNIDSASVILSTERTFTSSQEGIYKCRGHFLGSTGSNCYFEKTVVIGAIYPYAAYTYEIVDTNGCDVVVQFYNHSCATMDSAHTQLTSMECDGQMWDFGDGTVSYDKHPRHVFPSQEFNVSLTATLANGECSDDTTQTVLMLSPCITYDTLYPEICEGDTFQLRDSVMLTQGFYTVRTEYREDSIVTTFVYLTVHPTLDTNLLGGICDGAAYNLFGFNESVAGDYVHAFTSIYGCDSIYRLNLVVASSYDILIDDTLCSIPGYPYGDTVFTYTTFYVDSLLSVYACDSVITLDLTIYPAYDNNHSGSICEGDILSFEGTDYTASGNYPHVYSTTLGCDSIERLILTVYSFPVLTLSNDTVILPNTTAHLTATGSDMIDWKLRDGTLVGTGDSLEVSPTASTMYYVTGTTLVDNLVFNGDFELGDTGFYCSYFRAGTQLDSRKNAYAVGPSNFNVSSDHTTGSGNFLAIDGGPDTVVWNQTVGVSPNTDYVFSAWTRELGGNQLWKARLKFSINGIQQGDIDTIDMDTWSQFSFNWNSGNATMADIQIVDLETAKSPGNDFGVDDITFHSLEGMACTYTDSLKVYVATLVDSILCDNHIPLIWNGVTFTNSDSVWVVLNDSHGDDSTVVMRVTLRPTYFSSDTVGICRNEAYVYRGSNYYAPYFIEDSLLSTSGCDSVVNISLYIHDTTFYVNGFVGIDTLNWIQSDSSLYGCVPVTIYVRDSSQSYSGIYWDFGDGNYSTDTLGSHTYTDTGVFTVMLVAASDDGCHDTMTLVNAVQVFPRPLANFTWDPELPSNIEPWARLINLTEPADSTNTYKWYFYQLDSTSAIVDSSMEAEPYHVWPADDFLVDNHDVALIAYQWFYSLLGDTLFCTDTAILPVTVVNIYLQFPNSVTPNGDGINDTWFVVNLAEFDLYPVNRLRIYNRWGRLVFERNNISSEEDAWDPNDCDCPDGTYFYRFDAQGEFGYTRRNGVIEVLR